MFHIVITAAQKELWVSVCSVLSSRQLTAHPWHPIALHVRVSRPRDAPVRVPRKLLWAAHGSAAALNEWQMSQGSADTASQKYTGIFSRKAGRKCGCA